MAKLVFFPDPCNSFYAFSANMRLVSSAAASLGSAFINFEITSRYIALVHFVVTLFALFSVVCRLKRFE